MDNNTKSVITQAAYTTKGLTRLSKQKEMFCFHMATGAGIEASAEAVGTNVEIAQKWLEHPSVKGIIDGFRESHYQKVDFTRDKLALLFFQSYYKAATATEEIQALREIGKLQGLYAPQQTELKVNVTNVKHIEMSNDAQLAKLAGLDDPTVIDVNEYYER